MPDAIFSDPRLAAVYDPLDPDRSDLDVYAALVDELGARSVLDIGCGTGTFASMLASRGIDVTAVDPAGASLDVARTKPAAGRVRWLHGDATVVAAVLPGLRVDLATMTGNVAQVFVTDEGWAATLHAAAAALRPGGRLVFETRDPERAAWREWNREQSYSRTEVPGFGPVASWHDLTSVSGELVSFRTSLLFERSGETLRSDSTLRFRSRADVERSLVDAGFVLDEVRDAPDRPGRELVFVARRSA